MSRKHKGERQHFAQLINDMIERGAFSEQTAERLREFADGPPMYVLDGKTPRRVRDLMEWARYYSSGERQLGDDRIGDSRVSTIFLGIPAGGVFGPERHFETMVFGGRHNGLRVQYETYDAAIDGHAAVVAKVTLAEGN